ncbi:MAG: hypothetical protein SFU86_21125 [Pirellulaceae bacterium]|nr:hypothetical protein [Pirellulaceae bacterium]
MKKRPPPAVAVKPAQAEPDKPFVLPPNIVEAAPPAADPPAAAPLPPRSKEAPLANLLAEAQAAEFNLPTIDEARVASAGIRKVSGKHLTLYTDIPPGEVDELPAVFDAAVPLWCEYFGVDPAKVADWRIVGYAILAKERFKNAGLIPENLPGFPAGYSQGSQFWLYDQPSGYYRRHLTLHEGTHCLMNRWLGGAGPPWYMEGLAELLGTHEWAGGKLNLAIMPRTKEEVPYWGRVKIIKDEAAADRGLMLNEIMRYDAHAHLRNEPYGWCWGATAFLDAHPATQAAFRDLKRETKDRTIDFSKRFYDRLKPQWQNISEDWQLFVLHCDYGYDFARSATVRKLAEPLPAAGAVATISADRGWQSTGWKLEAGKTYVLTATGRYQVAAGPPAWPCEAGGITLRYHEHRPLGMLLAAVADLEMPVVITPLNQPQPIGLSGEITPAATGTLYLSINEASSGLADNSGSLTVEIRGK